MALILDTGPLLALFDSKDPDHAACRAMFLAAREPRVIPSPVLVELDYWLMKRTHMEIRLMFLDDIIAGAYRVANLEPDDYVRVRQICDQYAGMDVGFVDAAVLAITERLNEPKLATLDHRHFGAMQPRHVDALELVPA